jgi:serine/threonine protein phosphatase 1
MSDIHGETEVFKDMLELVNLRDKANKLILLGDYTDHLESKYDTLAFVKSLQEQYESQVIVLAGNHELMLMEDIDFGIMKSPLSRDVLIWLRSLPFFYETEAQIFVHAGVDEDAGEYWKLGTENYYFCSKYPHTTGSFYKDVIAGHIGTSTITGDKGFHGVYWDGESHYYIDGSTDQSGVIPLLKYDTELKRYSSFERLEVDAGVVKWVEYPIV